MTTKVQSTVNPSSSWYNQFDVTLTILQVQSEYEEYSYSVKVINPNDKGGYQVEQLQTKHPKLTTVKQIRSELTDQLKGFVDGASCEFGYLFPGHGLKGKQRVIENDEDVVAMYADYKGKRISTLWIKCSWKQHSSQRKRSHSPSASGQPPTSKRSNYDSHLTEVEMIMDKLKEKCEDKYTPLRAVKDWELFCPHTAY